MMVFKSFFFPLYIRYNADGMMEYKISHTDDWSPFPNHQLRRFTSEGTVVTPLYTESLKITDMKYKHLQDLKEVIPKDFHSFFDHLKH